jgi:hypothetical protein
MRVVIVLLACAAVGYVLNVILWLTSSSEHPSPDDLPARQGKGVKGQVDGRNRQSEGINLTVGDEHVSA